MKYYTNTQLSEVHDIKKQAVKEGKLNENKHVKIVHAEESLMYTLDCGNTRIKATRLDDKWILTKMK